MKKPKKKKSTNANAPDLDDSAADASAATEPADVQESTPVSVDGEPVARSAAVPALAFVILGALLFWGDTHLLSHGGELDARVHYPFESVREVDSFHIKAALDPRIVRGEGIYNQVCKACHQEDGMGGVAQGCPPLNGSDWVLGADTGRIAAIVMKGLTGPIVVSGKQYGTGTMTPFGDSLSDDDIAGVLSYVRNNWSNKAPLVDVATVKKIRAQIQARPGYMDVPTLMGLH